MLKLKDTLLLALRGDNQSANSLCKHFTNIAVAYLRTKAQKNFLLSNNLYKNIDDMAMDCIAELFGKRGECLYQLEDYFDKTEVEKKSDSELNTMIRRLIFSQVNDGIYRNYRSFDPSLSKIIRNLKRNLDSKNISDARYDSATGNIIFSALDERSKPNMPEEILEIKLSAYIADMSNSIDALEALKTILTGQKEYNNAFNLTNFAVLLRKGFAYQLVVENEQNLRKQQSPKRFNDLELHKFMKAVLDDFHSDFFSTYVESGKLSEKEFDTYLLICRSILETDYIKDLGQDGYYEHFHEYYPEIEYEEYRKNHRSVLEYMMKKIRSSLIDSLRKEENFSNTAKS